MDPVVNDVNSLKIGNVDIAVGLPSFMEADSIRFVVEQIDRGLHAHYPNLGHVIINSDNASSDGTMAVFSNTPTRAPKICLSTAPTDVGKGYNIASIFRKSHQIGAKVTACVDSDLTSISADWIRLLVDPILAGKDMVLPLYERSKYDGMITNNLCYPMLRSIVGLDIRQPIGGDFAVSERLVEYCLLQKWGESICGYGVDIFVTLNAVLDGFIYTQTNLGQKRHKPSHPKLARMFGEVASTLFDKLVSSKERWTGKTVTAPTDTIFNIGCKYDSQPDLSNLREEAKESYFNMNKRFNSIFSPKIRPELDKSICLEHPLISADLWCQAVFEALACVSRGFDCTEAGKLLTPVFLARACSLIEEVAPLSGTEAEAVVTLMSSQFWHRRPQIVRLLEASRC